MPISNPTAGDIHVNQPLTNFSEKWLQDQTMFVGLQAMPNLPVAKQSDLFYEFNRADFFRDEAAERADGTESQGGGFTVSTNPYFARVYAFHKDVTDRQRANQDSVVRLDQSSTQFVALKLMLHREALFQQTFFPAGAGSSTWTTEVVGNASPTAGQFEFWDRATSDPIRDVRTGIETVQGLTGLRPNKMLISRQSWNVLLDNDAILSRITGGARTDVPALVMRELVAQLFEMDAIHVMDSVVNSAVSGAAESTGFLAGDNALLYHAPDSLGLDQPSAGAQFSWTGFTGATDSGLRIKRFRMEETESDRIEGQMAFDYQVTSPELGYYFHNTIT